MSDVSPQRRLVVEGPDLLEQASGRMREVLTDM